MDSIVKLVHKKTGQIKQLKFAHAQRFLAIDNSFLCAKDSGFIFDGKELVKQPKKKKKKTEPKEDK